MASWSFFSLETLHIPNLHRSEKKAYHLTVVLMPFQYFIELSVLAVQQGNNVCPVSHKIVLNKSYFSHFSNFAGHVLVLEVVIFEGAVYQL